MLYLKNTNILAQLTGLRFSYLLYYVMFLIQGDDNKNLFLFTQNLLYTPSLKLWIFKLHLQPHRMLYAALRLFCLQRCLLFANNRLIVYFNNYRRLFLLHHLGNLLSFRIQWNIFESKRNEKCFDFEAICLHFISLSISLGLSDSFPRS